MVSLRKQVVFPFALKSQFVSESIDAVTVGLSLRVHIRITVACKVTVVQKLAKISVSAGIAISVTSANFMNAVAY